MRSAAASMLMLLTASEAADAVRRLSIVERKVTAAKARAAQRVDGSSVWKHAGFRTMAEWMAARTGDPVPVLTGLLDTAKKLGSCPATAEAFAAGEVSVAAAREIAGAVAVDPGAEAGLLAVARHGDHRRLRGSGRQGAPGGPVGARTKRPSTPGCGPDGSPVPTPTPTGWSS